MKRITFDCAGNSDTVSQMTGRLILWVENVDLESAVVIQGEHCARHILLRALGVFGKSLLGATSAIDNHPGPRT